VSKQETLPPPYRSPGVQDKPVPGYRLVVSPSPYTAEEFVLCYTRWLASAWIMGQLYVWQHPLSEVRIQKRRKP